MIPVLVYAISRQNEFDNCILPRYLMEDNESMKEGRRRNSSNERAECARLHKRLQSASSLRPNDA